MLSFWTVVKRSVCSRRGCYMNVLWRCTCRQESGSLTPWRREILLWGQVHRGYSHHQLSQKLHRERISGHLCISPDLLQYPPVKSIYTEPIKMVPYRKVTKWRKEGWNGGEHFIFHQTASHSIIFHGKRQLTEVLSCIDLVARFTLSDGDILEDYFCERSGKDLIKI